ncbi:PhaM family polyhydroxyalkanoate granule multifunctional regulatory protein [Tepidimonas sp.]|uniref:PhaM family polyhydroxyalkanoate granule multifunctional regulatory protein n=1 Tax=Tepidimonas sp. TaxID=2002775 RepID=UPI002FE19E8B
MTPPDFGAFQAAFAPYTRYVPGFAFLQSLAGGSPTADAPPMTQWVAPVFDVDELERRIRDLKAVHFWLEQNARALQATIQALEVQKMTLATLKGMNVSLHVHEMAQAFAGSGAHASPSAGSEAAAPDGAPAGEPLAEAPATAPGVDPVRWWRSLTDQFQTIAANTLQEMAQHTATAAATAMAATTAAPTAPATSPTTAPAPRVTRPARAAKRSQPPQSPVRGAAATRERKAAAPSPGAPTPAPAAARASRGRTAAPNPRAAPPAPPRRPRG